MTVVLAALLAAQLWGLPSCCWRWPSPLDLDGVRWIRALLRRLADEGRTELVSSHLLSEMRQVATGWW